MMIKSWRLWMATKAVSACRPAGRRLRISLTRKFSRSATSLHPIILPVSASVSASFAGSLANRAFSSSAPSRKSPAISSGSIFLRSPLRRQLMRFPSRNRRSFPSFMASASAISPSPPMAVSSPSSLPESAISSSFPFPDKSFLLREPSEKTIRLPLRPLCRIRHAQRQLFQNRIELRRRRRVHRLIHVIRRAVVPLFIPIVERLLFRRSWQPTKLERQRRYALSNEAVLIAPDKPVVIRLLVRLHLHARRLAHRANVLTQRRFAESLHFQVFQRKQRQEHVHVQIRHHAFGVYCRVLGKISRSQQPLLFPRHRQKQNGPLRLRSRFLHRPRDFNQ